MKMVEEGVLRKPSSHIQAAQRPTHVAQTLTILADKYVRQQDLPMLSILLKAIRVIRNDLKSQEIAATLAVEVLSGECLEEVEAGAAWVVLREIMEQTKEEYLAVSHEIHLCIRKCKFGKCLGHAIIII